MTGSYCSAQKNHPNHFKVLIGMLAVLMVLPLGCSNASDMVEPNPDASDFISPGLSDQDLATLSSLEQIDDFPLYTMVYEGDLKTDDDIISQQKYQENPAWACSLFAAYGDLNEILYGRNFDWDFSPAMLLFMDPPGGYSSVSMVDIYYLGFGGEQAFGITDLPLEDQIGLLDAPYIPFDGMNEMGLAIGMAAVPPGGMEEDPDKETIDSLMVIRKILDGAATIDEAVEIMRSYNIDMVGTPVHYLISEQSGQSALIEFSKGEIIVLPNEYPWQMATNFLVAEAGSDPGVQYGRYGTIEDKLFDTEGKLNPRQAITLLKDVSQPSTQWSVVYRISAGEVWVVMGGDYNQVHKLKSEFD
jgi:hypothetical protein